MSHTHASPLIRAGLGVSLLSSACIAHAADLAFDGNGAAPGTPGNGTWNTSAPNWFDGVSYRAWDNAVRDRAVFGTPGTATLTSAVTAGGLSFAAPGDYLLTGGAGLTLAGARDITLAEGARVSIASPFTGGFFVQGGAAPGGSSLTIQGNNTGVFSGVAHVGRGARLVLGHPGALGGDNAASQLVLDDGASLRFGTSGTYANHYTLTGGTVRIGSDAHFGTFSGSPVLTAATQLVFEAGAQTWSGTLADTGPHALSLAVRNNEGYGPTLGGTNTWSGTTHLVSGVLALQHAAAMSAQSLLSFEGFDPDSVPALGFRHAGTFARDLGTGAGQVRWSGSGGFRSFGPAMTVTLDGNAPLAWGRDHFVPDGASLLVGHAVTFTNAIDLGHVQRTIFGGGTLTGALTGDGGGLRLRDGALALQAANTYTGATHLDARNDQVFGAMLHLGHAQALPGGIGVAGGTSALVIDTGTIVLTPASGAFQRTLGAGAHQVRFTGHGGFGSASGVQVVDLGGDGRTLAWNADGFLADGAVLGFIGMTHQAHVDFRNNLDLAGGQRRIDLAASTLGDHVPLRSVHMRGVVSNGGLTFSGFGEAHLSGHNTYEGPTRLGNAGVDALRVSVARLADGGQASGIGASTRDAANLVFGTGGTPFPALVYVGGGDATDRDFTLAGNGEIVANGSGALTWNGSPHIASGTRTLRLGGTSTAANTFAGTLADGGGRLAVMKHGAGTWRLSGANTYTGGTSVGGPLSANAVDAGVLEVTSLGDAHEAGSLGINATNNAGNLLLFNRGVLRYVGEGESTNRNFRSASAATPGSGRLHGIAIESSGTGALTWAGRAELAPSVNPYLRLGGTNAGRNTFASVIADTSRAIFVAKDGSGTWGLAAANTYTGNTEVADGVLRLDHASALAGGLGANDAAGSAIRFDGGVLGLTEASGDLSRRTGLTERRNVVGWNADADGGFAAFGDARVVSLADGAALAWGVDGFVGGGRLLLSHATSDATLDFRNPMDFAGAARTIDVADGAHALDAIVAGTLTGDGASGLTKTGAGTVRLSGTSTYAGRSDLRGGIVEVEAIGRRGEAGNLGRGLDGADALWLDGATLRYLGAGDDTDRGLTLGAGGGAIESSGAGALAFDGGVRSGGGSTLALSGANADANRIGGRIEATTLSKSGAGTWLLTGDSALAQVDIADGTLQLGAGGATGHVGDAATRNAGTLVLARAGVAGIGGVLSGDGALVQRGPGTSVLIAAGSRAGRVAVDAGTLRVDGTLATPTLAIGDATLHVAGGRLDADDAALALSATPGTASTVIVERGGLLRATGDLGDGDDRVRLGIATHALSLAGGSGDDHLELAGVDADLRVVAGLAQFEHLHLRDATRFALDATLDHALHIDASSRLTAHGGARLAGDVANAGLIDAGAVRLVLDGDYTAMPGAMLSVLVSPEASTAGGLVLHGNAAGATRVRFTGDGTQGIAPATIRVIEGDAAQAAGFVAADAFEGRVRLQGSPFGWTFARGTDAWTLSAEADAPFLPEFPGQAVAPAIAAHGLGQAQRALFDRLAAMRDEDCVADAPRDAAVPDACRGAWVAAIGGAITVGADPGVAFDGSMHGMLAGADRVFPSRPGTTFRAGLYGGVLQGRHATSGHTSAPHLPSGRAQLRSSLPTVGAHATRAWDDGRFVAGTLAAQRPETDVHAADGHRDRVLGNALALRAQAGWRRAGARWFVEPHADVALAARHWRDRHDAGGRDVLMRDDVVTTARTGLGFGAAASTWRPWGRVAVEETFGLARDAVRVLGQDGGFVALPAHRPGLRAEAAAGEEADLRTGLRLFGAVSRVHGLAGSTWTERAAHAGVRWHW
jgi:fibronectin-binding autotransporter adhesin